MPHNRSLACLRVLERPARLLPALLMLLGLSACGVGSDDLFGRSAPIASSPSGSGLQIVTTQVPDGSLGGTYPATALHAAGARGPVTWSLEGGRTPPGIGLSADGRLSGVPAARGFFEFSVRATDGLDSDVQHLAVAVDTFGVTVVGGLNYGDAWSGVPVALSCSGFTGPVRMDVLRSESGGNLQSADGALGDATYLPGHTAGVAHDLVRATDTGTGAVAEVEIRVVANPTDTHVARFGSTDVWHLDFSGKFGAHPYVSDYHAALASLGLRGLQSTDRRGSDADHLADLLVRVRTLEQINVMYLRNADGTAGAGLGISFPLDRPGAGYTLPAPGSFTSAAPNRFSVMAICDGDIVGVLGSAFADAVGNPLQEHNAPGGSFGPLGAFVNKVAMSIKVLYREYGEGLRARPLDAGDLDALRALLYHQPSPGGRYVEIEYVVHGLARSIAAVAAHEIGHSLGLTHNVTPAPNGIMNRATAMTPEAEYYFTPENLALLQAGLPGPNRGTASQTLEGKPVAAAVLPEGGVQVCCGAVAETE